MEDKNSAYDLIWSDDTQYIYIICKYIYIIYIVFFVQAYTVHVLFKHLNVSWSFSYFSLGEIRLPRTNMQNGIRWPQAAKGPLNRPLELDFIYRFFMTPNHIHRGNIQKQSLGYVIIMLLLAYRNPSLSIYSKLPKTLLLQSISNANMFFCSTMAMLGKLRIYEYDFCNTSLIPQPNRAHIWWRALYQKYELGVSRLNLFCFQFYFGINNQRCYSTKLNTCQ